MALWQKFSLRTRLNLILLLILTGFLAISLSWQYRQQRALVFAEAVAKARIITTEATRTREYLSTQLQAGRVELTRERYGLIPVVVANRVGQLVADDLSYTIRHVSGRYRNQANAADSFELEALRRLAADPERTPVAELATAAGTPVFRYLQAALAEESCLECHGDPQRSPLFLREIYPPDQDPSYQYQIGEVIGAVSVVIPMDPIEQRLAAGFRNTLLTTGGFFLALVLCLGLFLRVAVIRPLRGLAATIGTIRQTGRFTERLPVRAQDEIGELVNSFNAMSGELGARTAQLEESEKRFRLLTETARDAIVAFLPSGQIFLFSRRAEALFGYTQAELLGEPLDRLIAPEPDGHGPSLTAFLARAPERWFNEVHLVTGLRRDRTPLRLEICVTVVATGDRPFFTASLRETAPIGGGAAPAPG